MNKFLVYTSNLRENPRTMRDVIRFAEETPKFNITNVELNGTLANVKAGDNIITTKGNSLYVLRTFDKSLEEMSSEDRAYIDDKTRRFGMKKVGITGVSHVIKFETWCKDARSLVETSEVNKTYTTSKSEKKMVEKNSLSNLSERLKEHFMPIEAKDVRIAHDGNICVETADGYVSIDANNQLNTYPVEFTLELPVYVISRAVAQLQVGDIILRGNRYYKITKISDDYRTISTIGYNGVGHTAHPINDFALGASERVVVSLAGNIAGAGINPMLMMLMSSKDNKKMDSILPLLLMTQNGGNIAGNPMLPLALLAGDKDGKGLDIKDIFMMSALGGGNLFGGAAAAPAAPVIPAGGLFGNLFGGFAPAAPAAPAAAAPAAPARKRPAKKNAAPAAE